MKYLLTILIFTALFNHSYAQKQDDIKLMATLQSSDKEVVTYAKDYLLNKIKNEITRDGYAGVNTSRFMLSVNPVVTDKQNTGQLILYTYDMQFSVVDMMTDKMYTSFSVPMAGAGQSEGQAVMDALRRVDFSRSKLADNLRDAVAQIVRYYNDNCSAIVARSNALLVAKQYDEALANLAFIPDMSHLSCAGEYNNTMTKVYQQYEGYRCRQAFSQANTAWNLDPTKQGAATVASILAGVEISPDCKNEVNGLITEIKKKLVADQFDEKEFRNKVFDSKVAADHDMVSAARDVATAYYKSKMGDTYVYLK